MTANDESPAEGQDSIDIGFEAFPLEGASDEDLAMELEDRKQDARAAVDRVNRSLLNADMENDVPPLRHDDLEDLAVAADALSALWRTLCLRLEERNE